MGLLHIYDDGDWRMQIMTKRSDAQAVVPVQGGALKFVEHMDSIAQSGWQFDRVLFETHGCPGYIFFGDDGIDPRWMRSLKGRGYEKICGANARLYFNGCNVAEGDNGLDFLRASAEVFLIGRGGMAFGHTSLGVANPFNGHVVHLWGDTKYISIAPGG